MLAFIITAILAIQADFVQTRHVALMSEPQVSTGHMVYRAPDYLQWAYRTPSPLIWEIDGDKSNVTPQVQRLLRMIMSSIASDGNVDAIAERESRKLFRSVQISMDENTGVARRVEMIDKNGDTTIIEFINVIAE